MAQFQYTAVNSSGKKLNGVIGAASEDDARKQLNTFGISVLAIQKVAETGDKSPTQEPGTSNELSKFEFEAVDKNGRKVLGTIPASNRYKAFKRLQEEYQFEVGYVVPLGSTPEQKAEARREDLALLKAQYGADENVAPEATAEAGPEQNPEFEQKRAALLKKVDFILDKIKKLMAEFGEQIRPENKKIIQDYIDKLLRIKSSTNLDYIEHTSEELLKKVQDQELFLHKENMKAQQAKVKLESQQLMAELHSGEAPQSGMSSALQGMHQRLVRSESRFLKGLGQQLQPYIETEEEKELKKRIRSIGRQVWTFRKLWLSSPKEAKFEAKASLDKILEEKKRLQQEAKVLATQRRKRSKLAAPKGKKAAELNEPLITEELNSLLGWLLGFYLVAYFLSHYVLAKVFPGGNPLPGDFNLLESTPLRMLLLSVFLWYVLLSLRIEFLRYKNWANAFVIPLGILINATLVFNF